MTLTVTDFFRQFPTDDACLEHLWEVRFGDEVECPKCSKVGKFYRLSKEPAYSCPRCGHHIHPMVGTPLEKSHTSLQKWFYRHVPVHDDAAWRSGEGASAPTWGDVQDRMAHGPRNPQVHG